MSDGYQLSEEARAHVERMKLVGINLSTPIPELRRLRELRIPEINGDFKFEGTREDITIPCTGKDGGYAVPITVLRPRNQQGNWTRITVFFHGGGWVLGSRATHMGCCERIAQSSNCVVVNVEYRLAPEHRYPACYEDAQSVLRWCLDNKLQLAGTDKCLLGVAGDSAGGNISASVCHLVPGIDYQVLLYPSIDLASSEQYPSYEKYGDGLLLTKQLMTWFREHFIGPEEKGSTLASPLFHKSFVGLPPALFIVSECDPLADQAPEYEKKLKDAGVRTEFFLLKGGVHGFVSSPGLFENTMKTLVDKVSEFLASL